MRVRPSSQGVQGPSPGVRGELTQRVRGSSLGVRAPSLRVRTRSLEVRALSSASPQPRASVAGRGRVRSRDRRRYLMPPMAPSARASRARHRVCRSNSAPAPRGASAPDRLGGPSDMRPRRDRETFRSPGVAVPQPRARGKRQHPRMEPVVEPGVERGASPRSRTHAISRQPPAPSSVSWKLEAGSSYASLNAIIGSILVARRAGM